MKRRTTSGPGPTDAFSLVEVVVAVGIFAVGIVAVLGLFAPVAQSVAANREAEAAAGAADVLLSQLRAQPFATVAGYLKAAAQFQQDNAGSGYNPAADEQMFYASLTGDKIGLRHDPIWAGSDRDKYFELTLLRNEDLSPANNDEVAAWLAFNVRMRWPLFLPLANGGSVQVGTNSAAGVFDHGSKQVLLFSGSVRR